MEEMEVPTEHLHEAINEHAEESLEKKENRWSLYVAISTALMAVCAAITSLLAGHHSDEALIQQILASDQWAYYQAKGIKAEIKSIQPDGAADVQRYKHEQEDIQKQAKEHETDSHEHLARHMVLSRGVTLFQISIAISAISILTKKKFMWFVSIALALTGLYFFITGIL